MSLATPHQLPKSRRKLYLALEILCVVWGTHAGDCQGLRGDQLGDLFVAHARDVGVRVQRGLDVVVEVHVRQLRL